MQASGLCRILNARCATAPTLCGSWTTSVGSKRHSPGSGIVSKLVRNDAGGNTDSSRDIGQVGAQSFHQGLLAAMACKQPAVRERVERAEEA